MTLRRLPFPWAPGLAAMLEAAVTDDDRRVQLRHDAAMVFRRHGMMLHLAALADEERGIYARTWLNTILPRR